MRTSCLPPQPASILHRKQMTQTWWHELIECASSSGGDKPISMVQRARVRELFHNSWGQLCVRKKFYDSINHRRRQSRKRIFYRSIEIANQAWRSVGQQPANLKSLWLSIGVEPTSTTTNKSISYATTTISDHMILTCRMNVMGTWPWKYQEQKQKIISQTAPTIHQVSAKLP